MEYAGKNVKIRKQELTKNIQKKKYRTLGKAENSEYENFNISDGTTELLSAT